MMTCVELAVKFLSKAIAETVQEGTDRNDGVCFEKYLEELCKSEKYMEVTSCCEIANDFGKKVSAAK